MSDALGGGLEPQQLAGRKYEILLAFNVEFRMTVTAGHHRDDAVEEASLRADIGTTGTVAPSDWDLVHSEVDAIENIYADDPRAEQCLDWFDGPTAPSEDTFWDDSRHFDGETTEDYSVGESRE